MKIIYYEMRKSWLKATTFIVLIVFIVLNFVRMNDMCRIKYSMTYGNAGKAYHEVFDSLCGELTEEKIKPFRERAKELEDDVMDMVYSYEYQPDKYHTGYVWGDFMLYNVEIAPEITYCVTYPNTSNKIAQNAAEGYGFYSSIGNDFEAEKNAMIYEIYRNRSIPEYRATYWTSVFWRHDFSSLLCIILLILGLSASFSAEKSSGMRQLIISYGRTNKTIISKIISSAIYCAVLSVLFTAVDLVSVDLLLGVDGLNMPIYSARIFENTPFNFSLLRAIFLWTALRFLALLCISLIIMFFSEIMPNTIAAMCCSFGVSLILMLLTAFSKNIFNPISALTPKTYFENFSVVNVLGKPILTLTAALIALALECLLLSGAIFACKRFLR